MKSRNRTTGPSVETRHEHGPEDWSTRIEQAADVLEALEEDRALLAQVDKELRVRLLRAAGRVARPDRHARKALAREQIRSSRRAGRDADEALLARTGIRQLREVPIFQTPLRLALGPATPALPPTRDRRIASDDSSTRTGDGLPGPASVDEGGEREEFAREVPEATASRVHVEATTFGPHVGDVRHHVLGEDAPSSPPLGEMHEERTCYVCRTPYRAVHHFYDHMCLACGDFNYAKRDPRADLRGRTALVTGARVKIGYQAAIMLLRAGAQVVVLTRFPHDAARRYAAEPDVEAWGDRLRIHGIDLRHTPSVERLCDLLNATLERLDFVINNACQTVRRPAGFYEHLLALETDPAALTDRERRLLGPATADHQHAEGLARSGAGAASARMTQLELLHEDRERGEALFPAGALDADLQQVDLREVNSWRLKLADVSAVELLEVHLVNAVAPFLLNARLKPLMCRTPERDKHIVNVSAMEGQFYRVFKSDRHPHTNMAKAALNMMTRTSAADYVRDGIHMNSVDTGWVTDEDPDHHARLKRDMHRFHPPLDIVDGAARIVDPIFHGVRTGEHVWGQFLKDYMVTDW